MRQKLNSEQLRSFMLALMLIGVAALLFGAYRFVDAATRIQNNPAFLMQSSGQTVSPQDAGTAESLIAAGMEYRRLVGQRNEALIIGGAGVILLAVGWLGSDVLKSRHKLVEAS